MNKSTATFLTNYSNPRAIGYRFRKNRIKPLQDVIDRVYARDGSVSIIDLGGTEQYWGILGIDYLRSRGVVITLVNLPGCTSEPVDIDVFNSVEGDACSILIDRQFSIVHSNSVIEHVGDWGQMQNFAREVKRLSDCYFIQTPNFWFPIEPHCMTPFFHWLPKPIRVWLVGKLALGHWKKADSIIDAVTITESARLLDRRMFGALFSEAEIITERFLFMPKSLIAFKNPKV